MKIEYQLTPADVANARAMRQSATPPLSNRTLVVIPGVYALVGLFLIGLIFDLSMNALIALLFYVAGLLWLVLALMKRSIARTRSRKPKETSMKRVYTLTDGGLEVQDEDLTHSVSARCIVRVVSAERGTLVHLQHSLPLFLPFGPAFRNDFVDALRRKVEQA